MTERKDVPFYARPNVSLAELHELHKTIEMQQARIVELEAANRWIPVEERLPEDLIPVLVKGTSDNPHRAGCEVTWCFYHKWTGTLVNDITHWRPLPEPPVESKQTKEVE
jgi:hypothetical protein